MSHVKTLTDQRPALAARLRAWADDLSEERAFWVRQLSELDDDTERHLTDPDVEVRICAALAPNLADNATATDLIVAGVFRQAGLPFDREACARIAERRPGPHRRES